MFTTSRDLFLRSQPRILIENYPLKEIPFYNISNENFFFAFRFESSFDIIQDYEDYFTIKLEIVKYSISKDSWSTQSLTQLN